MKRFATVLCLAALIAVPAVAAPPSGGPGSDQGPQPSGQEQPRPKGPDMKALAQQLGLNEDQTARLKTIMEKHRQEMQVMHQTMREGGMQRGEAAMQQRHAQRDKHRQELLTVLSYEQLYKFEKFMEQNRPRMAGRGGPGMGGPGMQGSSSRPE